MKFLLQETSIEKEVYKVLNLPIVYKIEDVLPKSGKRKQY